MIRPIACQSEQHKLFLPLITRLASIGIMATVTAPTSQTAPALIPPSVCTLPHTAQLEALYTIIRDKQTSRGDFLFYSDRIIRLLVEEGLNHLPVVPKTVKTPTVSKAEILHQAIVIKLVLQGATYDGVGFEGKICGVSILRAGEASVFHRIRI